MGHKKIKGSNGHLTVSKLSRMSSKDLRAMDHLKFVVTKKHETLAVVIPYDQYCEMKRAMKRMEREVDQFAQDAQFFRGAH